MRDKHYKVKTFRLSEEVYKKLADFKNEESWNLAFTKLLEYVDKSVVKNKITKIINK